MGEDGFEREEAGVGEVSEAAAIILAISDRIQKGRGPRGCTSPVESLTDARARGGEPACTRRLAVPVRMGHAALTSGGRSTAQGPPGNASLSGLHNCKGVLFPATFRSKDFALRLGAAISISLENS